MAALRFLPPLSAREAAAQVLYAFLEGKEADLAPLLDQAGADLDARDRAFLRALVYGTLTSRIRLEWVLGRLSSRPVEKLDPWLKTVLLLGLWQLRESASAPASAVVNESCELVKRYLHSGATSYANALLRREAANPTQIPAKNLSLQFSLLPELAGYFKKAFGAEGAARELQALAASPPLTIRVNRAKTTLGELRDRLGQEGCRTEAPSFHPDALELHLQGRALTSLESFRDGWFFVQGEAAMLVASLVELQEGQRLVDLCAAPGGKISQVAETAPPSCYLLARDTLPNRLERMRENLVRLRLQARVELALADATKPAPELRESFDYVLADVPCSGLGLIGRKPDIRWRMTHERIEGLLPIQQAILRQAADMVKPGGCLVYSTCTLNPGENGAQVERFLGSEEGRGFVRVPFRDSLPDALLRKLCDSQRAELERGELTLLPSVCGCEGFYLSLLKKIKE